MYIYLLTFAASILMCTLVETRVISVIESKNIIIGILFFIVALIPAILGGVRDYTIGTDIRVYGNVWFNLAHESSNIFEYLKMASSSSFGYLYALFNFLVSRFTNNPHWFYFWYCLVENLIVLLALWENRDIVNITIGWATYLFMFYNINLNMLRQGMAVVILLLGFKYIRKRQLINFLLIVFIAYLFHNTAVIGVVLYPIYQMIFRRTKENKSQIPVFILAIMFTFLFGPATEELLSIGILSTRYLSYINANDAKPGFSYLFYLVLLVIAIITKASIKDTKYVFFETILFMCVLFSAFVNISFISRITTYFSIYLCFGLSYILGKNNKAIIVKKSKINNVIILVFIISYWVLIFGILNYNSTVPYIFMK